MTIRELINGLKEIASNYDPEQQVYITLTTKDKPIYLPIYSVSNFLHDFDEKAEVVPSITSILQITITES